MFYNTKILEEAKMTSMKRINKTALYVHNEIPSWSCILIDPENT